MSMDKLNRDLGRLEGKVEKLDDDVDDLKRMVAEIHQTISEARGGWKTLVVVGTVSSALTTAAIKAIAWLKGA
ncbi:hypothetical protein GCM10007235_32740 [Pseudoxanthomonas indica]|nr:hypothetical protein GCM10007235_32740 [Pseudoxanthomonas indica]